MLSLTGLICNNNDSAKTKLIGCHGSLQYITILMAVNNR